MKSWKKILSILLAATLLLAAASACKNNSKKSESKTETEEASDANFVSLQEGFTDVKVTDEKSALKAVSAASEDLGLNDPDQELRVTNTTSYDGETYYRFRQYYNDTPIYGRDVVLVADEDGKAISLSSNMVKSASGSTNEKKDPGSIDYQKLLGKVEELLKNDKTEFLNFECKTQPETVYYSGDNKTLRACFKDVISFNDADKNQYAFEILFDCDSYEPVSVDLVQFYGRSVSASGRDKEGNTREFNAYRDNAQKYLMLDDDNNIVVYNANNNTVVPIPVVVDDRGNVYYIINGKMMDENENPVTLSDDGDKVLDENGKVIGKNLKHEMRFAASPNSNALEISSSQSTVWTDRNAVSAVSRMKNAYDFYHEILGRNSYNNNGGAIRVFYNDDNNGDRTNAYSYDRPDMTVLSFGAENNIAFDVVGHEFTHSVVGSLVELPYRNQSGAINEAYADIFGEIIEDYSDGKMNNNCNWLTDTFRNQIDPESEGNPVKYKGKNWAPTISVPDILKNTPLGVINMYTDNGGVHTNSTVLSHAAYLMFNGIDGNASKKIGTELLAKIWYKSMFSLHSDETFKKCAQHVYEAAARTNGVSKEQLECVKEAFAEANLKVK